MVLQITAILFLMAPAKIKGSVITTEPFLVFHYIQPHFSPYSPFSILSSSSLDPAVKICYNTSWFGQ